MCDLSLNESGMLQIHDVCVCLCVWACTCSLWLCRCSSCRCSSSCWMCVSCCSLCVCVSCCSSVYRLCSSSRLDFRARISSSWALSCSFCNTHKHTQRWRSDICSVWPTTYRWAGVASIMTSFWIQLDQKRRGGRGENEEHEKKRRDEFKGEWRRTDRQTQEVKKQMRKQRRFVLPWRCCAPPAQWCWWLAAADGGFWPRAADAWIVRTAADCGPATADSSENEAPPPGRSLTQRLGWNAFRASRSMNITKWSFLNAHPLKMACGWSFRRSCQHVYSSLCLFIEQHTILSESSWSSLLRELLLENAKHDGCGKSSPRFRNTKTRWWINKPVRLVVVSC